MKKSREEDRRSEYCFGKIELSNVKVGNVRAKI
jgi:hypothetical protein